VRTVVPCTEVVTDKERSTGAVRLWAFGYADLARAFDVEVEEMRSAVRRKKLDPRDLTSILKYAESRRAGPRYPAPDSPDSEGPRGPSESENAESPTPDLKNTSEPR